jgi:hypothetical protein
MSEEMNLFQHFDPSQKRLVYMGLLSLVKSNSGLGFQNSDQGLPAYAVGKRGEVDQQAWGDSPDNNKLFRMMHQLAIDLNAGEIDRSSEIQDYVFSWADFCSLAYEAHQKHGS